LGLKGKISWTLIVFTLRPTAQATLYGWNTIHITLAWESWIAINLFVTLQSFFNNDIQYKCKSQNFVGLCEKLNTLISSLKAILIHGPCVLQTNKTGMSQKYFESSVARRLGQKLKHSLSYLHMQYV
jgi:hypothetical protein